MAIQLIISCDKCRVDMRQSNRWFLAYEHEGELRLSGWSLRQSERPRAYHLCGHTCLHRLVDNFITYMTTGHREIAVAEQISPAAQAIPQPMPGAFEASASQSCAVAPGRLFG